MAFEYSLVAGILFIILTYYLKIAARYQLIDAANSRSSHTSPTIRGGGLVIPLVVLLHSVIHWQFNSFIIGLALVSLVSFWDDLKTLPSRVRIIVQLLAVILLIYSLIDFSGSFFTIFLATIVLVGTINAANFMDGINGISVVFGMVFVGTLLYINQDILFVDSSLLIYSGIGLLVFGFYNFRIKARCFAGDVGSVSLGYILIYFSLLFYLATGNESILVLWSVYGVDSVLTIIHRIMKRENIFKAHRSHLYQYCANELNMSHLSVSIIYGAVQLVINLIFIANLHYQILQPFQFTILVLAVAGFIYIIIRLFVIRLIKN